MSVVVHHIQNGEACKSETSREQAEEETLSDAVGDRGYDHSIDERAEVGRNVEKLRRDSTVAIALNNCGREVC